MIPPETLIEIDAADLESMVNPTIARVDIKRKDGKTALLSLSVHMFNGRVIATLTASGTTRFRKLSAPWRLIIKETPEVQCVNNKAREYISSQQARAFGLHRSRRAKHGFLVLVHVNGQPKHLGWVIPHGYYLEDIRQ